MKDKGLELVLNFCKLCLVLYAGQLANLEHNLVPYWPFSQKVSTQIMKRFNANNEPSWLPYS